MFLRLKQLATKTLGHAGLRRYAANTSWLFAEQILRMVAGLLVGIWVARYLGPSQFGLFSYAIAFTALLGGLAKLGLDSIVVRDLVRMPELRDVYLGTAFWLKIMGAVAMLTTMALAVRLTSNDATTNLYIFIIGSGTLFQSFEVVDFYFQSKVLSKFVSICKLIQLLISSLIKLYLVYIGSGLFWFVLVSLVDQATLAVTLFFVYRSQKVGGFIFRFDALIAKRLLQDSWPQILTGLVIMIYMRIDQIMIKEMLDESQVGLYSAAVRISEIFYFIPMIITSSLFPAVVAAKNTSEKLYFMRTQRLFTVLVWMAIAIAIPVTFLHEWLVVLLYGVDYKEAGKALMISIWAGIFVFYGAARGRWLIIENMQNYGVICTSVGAITNIGLNLILIKKMGITGAAIATFISQGVSAIVVPLFFKKDRGSVLMFLNTFNPYKKLS